MNMDEDTLNALRPLIEAARKEIADMDSDDVPASLRRVAKSSARTLPPPFAKSLVHAMIDSRDFRSAVRDRYDAERHSDADLSTFLEDPEAGLERIRSGADRQSEARAAGELDAAHDRIQSLVEQLAEAKRRMSALRSDHAAELSEARKAVAEDTLRAEAKVRKLDETAAEQQSVIDELGAERDRLMADLEDSAQRLARVTERARKRDEQPGPAPGASRVDMSPSDPVAFAQWLDDIERIARPFRDKDAIPAPDVRTRPPVHAPLRVPSGIAPDSGSVLAALIDQKPRRFIIDGYNIGGQLHGDKFPTRDARDDVISRAGRLARKTEAEIIVVFDGPEEEGREGFRSPAGVSVLFSRGEKADDVIADLVRSEPDGTVVVTNDRELRSRCTIDGCVPIWSSAFIDWA